MSPEPSVHAHVERRALAKGKSARLIVDLVRRNAEIGKNAVEFLPRVVEQPVCLGEVAQYNAKSACRLMGCKPISSCSDAAGSRSIAVTFAPNARRAALCPPPPKVQSRIVFAPRNSSTISSASTGAW